MKMKWLKVIGATLLVSLSACDSLTDIVDNGAAALQKATEKGWEYSAKVDKLTQEQSISAKKEFVDKDVDFVRADVELTCTNSAGLYATITTYDTRPDKDGNLSGATMSYDSDKINLIETRSGKNPINYLIALPDFSNELIFNVAHPDDGAALLLFQLKMLGIDIPKESASLMVGSHWIIRVNTELGNPTITVDLNDPIVKKVTSQCKWKPAFSNSHPTVNMDSSNVTEKTKANSKETENDVNQTKAIFLGYEDTDKGCNSYFKINEEKVEVKGCPKVRTDYTDFDVFQTKATFVGYAEQDWGCSSDFKINEKNVEVEGCPKDKTIYENNKGAALTLMYSISMPEGFKTYNFIDVRE